MVSKFARCLHDFRRNNIDNETRERMVNFIEYKFENQMGTEEADILDELSDSLRIAALKEMHLDNLKKISWLIFDDESFMHELLQLLIPETFGPDDIVFRKGEVGTTLYFVVSGKCRLSKIGGGKTKVLGEGSFFGEMSVLFDERRSATIQAITFVNVFELTQYVSAVHCTVMAWPVPYSALLSLFMCACTHIISFWWLPFSNPFEIQVRSARPYRSLPGLSKDHAGSSHRACQGCIQGEL